MLAPVLPRPLPWPCCPASRPTPGPFRHHDSRARRPLHNPVLRKVEGPGLGCPFVLRLSKGERTAAAGPLVAISIMPFPPPRFIPSCSSAMATQPACADQTPPRDQPIVTPSDSEGSKILICHVIPTKTTLAISGHPSFQPQSRNLSVGLGFGYLPLVAVIAGGVMGGRRLLV